MPPDNAVVFKRKFSDALIRSLTEPGKHADGEVPGLYLEVRASSKVGKSPPKVWRLKYRLHGKENRFSIGAYPDIGLKINSFPLFNNLARRNQAMPLDKKSSGVPGPPLLIKKHDR